MTHSMYDLYASVKRLVSMATSYASLILVCTLVHLPVYAIVIINSNKYGFALYEYAKRTTCTKCQWLFYSVIFVFSECFPTVVKMQLMVTGTLVLGTYRRYLSRRQDANQETSNPIVTVLKCCDIIYNLGAFTGMSAEMAILYIMLVLIERIIYVVQCMQAAFSIGRVAACIAVVGVMLHLWLYLYFVHNLVNFLFYRSFKASRRRRSRGAPPSHWWTMHLGSNRISRIFAFQAITQLMMLDPIVDDTLMWTRVFWKAVVMLIECLQAWMNMTSSSVIRCLTANIELHLSIIYLKNAVVMLYWCYMLIWIHNYYGGRSGRQNTIVDIWRNITIDDLCIFG